MRTIVALATALGLWTGCSGSLSIELFFGEDTSPAPSTAVVVSDPRLDGDVREDGIVTTGAVILAGFDPAAASPRPEYRGFLSFPIDAVPVGAFVEAASVTLFADRVDLLPGMADVILDFDHVHYGTGLSFSAFGASGVPVRSVAAGMTLTPSPAPQAVSFDVTPEVQADVNSSSVHSFQLRIFGSGGLAQIVDGAGNRAAGLPPSPSLAPNLTLRFR